MQDKHERLVLFSQPSPVVLEKLKTALFPEYVKERTLAYMPSDGSNKVGNPKYTAFWRQFAESNDAKFIEIDNSKRGEEAKQEAQKIMSANILMITGGNTFKLLDHLRQSGLDKTIINFWQKENIVLSGFSAGALVLTPTIEICNLPNYDKNEVGLKDLTGLGIVDFEVFPHYSDEYRENFENYSKNASHEVKKISNEDCIISDL